MKFPYLLLASALLWSSATATPITPSFTTFGSLPGATFGGTGISNSAVAITTFTSGDYGITLGLTATGRYSNANPTNNGAGTFYAAAGGDTANGQPGYSTWNFDYYVNFNPDLSDLNAKGYSVRLYYDLNPAAGNDVTSFVYLEPNILNGLNFDSQNSWNLGMSSLFPPGFNPSVNGEYSFALAVLNSDGTEIGRSAINVNVGNVPDGGTTSVLLGLGLMGLIASRRWFKA